MASKNTICLWYDRDALEAAQFYAQTFPDSAVQRVLRAPGDYPSGKQGDVLTVEFTVIGIPCLGLNGGPAFKHSEAFSFQIATEDQAETDRLWDAIVGNGGQESECGWCRDKWGLSWQITPRVLMEAIADPDPAAAKRAFEAMMTMRKIDIAQIEAAFAGEREEDGVSDAPEIVGCEALHYVAPPMAVPQAEIGRHALPRLQQLHGWMAQNHIAPTGPSIIRYRFIDMAGLLEIEYGSPVAAPAMAAVHMVAGILPAGSYARLTHLGVYENLARSTGRLLDWIAESGLEADAVDTGAGKRFAGRYEDYRISPVDTSNMDALETDIYIKLADPS